MEYLVGPVALHTTLVNDKNITLISDIHDKNIILDVKCINPCQCRYIGIVEYIQRMINNNGVANIFVETPYNHKIYEKNMLRDCKSHGMLRTIVENFEPYFYNNKTTKHPGTLFHAVDIRYNTDSEFCEPLTKLFHVFRDSHIEPDVKLLLSYLLSRTLFPKPVKDFFFTPLGSYYKLLLTSDNVIIEYNKWKHALIDIDPIMMMLRYKLGAYHSRTGAFPHYIELVDVVTVKYKEFFEEIDNFTSIRGINTYHKIALQLVKLPYHERTAITEYYMTKLQTLWAKGNLFIYYKTIWDTWNTVIEGNNQIPYPDINKLLSCNTNPGLEFGSVLHDVYTIARMFRNLSNMVIVAGRQHINSVKDFLKFYFGVTFATYEYERIRDTNLIRL